MIWRKQELRKRLKRRERETDRKKKQTGDAKQEMLNQKEDSKDD